MKATSWREQIKGSLLIVTYGRSGSTLLQTMLQTIPNAHIVGENYNALFPIYQSVRRAQRTRRVWGAKHPPKDHPWFGADQVRPRMYAQRLTDAFVGEILRPPEGTRWLGFKEIRYASMGNEFSGYMDFLRDIFPNAFLVFNSREAEGVLASGWWRNWSPDNVREMVRTMDMRFAEYASAHPGVSHHVFHERTIANPACIGEIFEKIGEPFDLNSIQARLGKRLDH